MTYFHGLFLQDPVKLSTRWQSLIERTKKNLERNNRSYDERIFFHLELLYLGLPNPPDNFVIYQPN